MNTIEITAFNELAEPRQLSVAQQVSDFTSCRLGEQPQMLAVTQQQVMEKHAAFAALDGEELAGYIAATDPTPWQNGFMVEVGSLWVPKQLRLQGIAHDLVRIMTDHLLDQQKLPYAFCNPSSEPIFKAAGYMTAAQTELPPAAFSLCGICRYLPPEGCCDKPLIYADETA